MDNVRLVDSDRIEGGGMTNAAPWLKAMENGGLGEARAKAFLMDRFWVLERSVDVEGADYLVQRRLTAQNFMDRDPPRLGIVQVKFIQDGNTSISIHKSYVCDDKGAPYNEFFLLVFTGREDNEKSYLLSSVEICKEFRERNDGDRILLSIKGSKLMANSNYEVLQKRRALDRIEHALVNADFMSNRRFLGGSSYIKISPDQIDADLLVPLDNPYCDIGEHFFKEKKKLQSTLYDIEEVVEAMQKMLRATDPEEAISIYEDVISQHVGGSYGRDKICFSCDFFDDEDFLLVVINHKKRLSKLREIGVEGSYLKLLEHFEETVIQRLADPSFSANTETIRVKVTYDFETLRGVVVEVSARDTSEKKPHVASSIKGKQVVYYDLKSSLPNFSRTNATDTKLRSELVRKSIWVIRRPFQAALDALLLGDDLVPF